jgi:uncharacterized protein YggE
MAEKQGMNLSVTGTGKVLVAPDEAAVHLSIITEARTAAEAVAANARQTQAVIAAVSAQPNHGVTTSGLSVYPIINYEPNTSVPTIVGYVGQVYDAGISAGANQSSGITFRVQHETPYREEALRLAIQEAFREARVVAQAANIELGEVESIQVDPGDGIIFFRSEAIDMKVPSTPVVPERQSITARVQVQFRSRDTLETRPGKMDRDQRDLKRTPGTA